MLLYGYTIRLIPTYKAYHSNRFIVNFINPLKKSALRLSSFIPIFLIFNRKLRISTHELCNFRQHSPKHYGIKIFFLNKSESRFHSPFNPTTKIRQSISEDQIIKRETNKNSHLSHLYEHIKQLSKTLR